MRSYLDVARKPCRIALVLVLTPLCGAWTCNAFFRFESCQTSAPQAQVSGLSPKAISADEASVVLIVNGSGFVRQSQILWNGNPVQTTFTDSGHLQATITQQTLDSFGGRAGDSALISVVSPGSTSTSGCSNGRRSSSLALEID